MRLGYSDPYEQDQIHAMRLDKLEKTRDSFLLYIDDYKIEEVNLAELFKEHDVCLTELKYLDLAMFEVELTHTDILSEALNLEKVRFNNMELDSLAWLKQTQRLREINLNIIAKDTSFHYLKYQTQVEYLDLFGCWIKDSDVYINSEETIFDEMNNLKYLNLRESCIRNPKFIQRFKAKDMFLNLLDGETIFDMTGYDSIKLITVMNLINGSKFDTITRTFF